MHDDNIDNAIMSQEGSEMLLGMGREKDWLFKMIQSPTDGLFPPSPPFAEPHSRMASLPPSLARPSGYLADSLSHQAGIRIRAFIHRSISLSFPLSLHYARRHRSINFIVDLRLR